MGAPTSLKGLHPAVCDNARFHRFVGSKFCKYPRLAGGSKGASLHCGENTFPLYLVLSSKTSFRVTRQPEHSVWPQSSQLNRNPSALSQLHLFFFLKGCGKAKSIRVPFCLKHSTQRHICIYLVLVGQCRLVGAKQNNLQGII